MALTKITNEGIGTLAGDTTTLTLEDTSSHSANTGPAISFKSKDSGGTTREVAKVVGESHSGSNEGNLAFQTRNGGTLETKWKIFKNGNMLPSNSAYGIYLGTTSAADANLLHEYEEGTFTPTWAGYASSKINSTSGKYIRIGDHVTVYIKLVTGTDNDASSVSVNNLPFTISGDIGAGSVYHNIVGLREMHLVTRFNSNSTTCLLDGILSGSDTTIKYVGTNPQLGGSSTLMWILHYQTI